MVAVEPEIYSGTRQAFVLLTCPHCEDEVSFPFEVDITIEACDDKMPIYVTAASPVSDQPLFDHMLEKHGPII